MNTKNCSEQVTDPLDMAIVQMLDRWECASWCLAEELHVWEGGKEQAE